MAKQKNGNGKSGKDLEIVGPAPLPAHLQEHAKDGLEAQGESQMGSRLKIVQSSAAKELKADFSEGTTILTPDGVEVMAPEKPFLATPVYRWTTWAELRDANDPAEDFILGESNDVNGDLAKMAKNPATRKREYDGGKFTSKIAEHLNWVFLLHTGGVPNELCLFTFSRGSWGIGSRLLRTLQRHGAPIWSYMLEFYTATRTNKAGKTYWVLDFTLPKKYLCTEEQKPALHSHYKNFQGAFDLGNLKTPAERDEKASGEGAGDTAASA